MGVPALFRWLSKRYPKIVEPVVEDEAVAMKDADGNEVLIPVDTTLPNPNGFEADNLYLDMNGIVHPCTHPEGKPAPETEEDMMLEIFAYTDRVVNMARPRKLLFMAIDGVAPRAKMNQQRSRRFRSVKEAKEKDQEREAGIAMFEAMGHSISDETRNKKSWDTNAITPGTPFMDLLASSLRYWVVRKLNTDPAWKNLKVIISDASVPGEGEHKIMDFIRRQRVNPGHNPNTQHVIYGLDADLIMLALATHEPYFRVLREDVFAKDANSRTCRICGQEGHFAAQCTGKKLVLDENGNESPVKKSSTSDKKPFIFLDVSVLREYLEIELNQPHVPFHFNLEQAIDDWVFLIFFVGNDFLPHLPSLEIREGAIDTLMKIWKQELPRLGGYLTDSGHVVMHRAEIILEGLARRENEIFRKRRESEQVIRARVQFFTNVTLITLSIQSLAEERQDQDAKRRRIESGGYGASQTNDLSNDLSMQATPYPYVPTSTSLTESPIHHSLPRRPAFDMAPADTPVPVLSSEGAKALSGTNADVVNNRRAIRLANMSAAEHLKAEFASIVPLGRNAVKRVTPTVPAIRESSDDASNIIPNSLIPAISDLPPFNENQDTHGQQHSVDIQNGFAEVSSIAVVDKISEPPTPFDDSAASGVSTEDSGERPHGIKRKIDEVHDSTPEAVDVSSDPEALEEMDEDQADTSVSTRVVNPDGTVEQIDTVRLWEPGYKERYYRQKFNIEAEDVEFRKQITKSYLEGLSWVLHYYYQGTPSWQWYYPYHFAPFASDFEDVAHVDIKFTLGMPSKPFEQLMGVFPAASRVHLPEPFQRLMIEEDSPIIDFYPEDFEIDMNGKKMAWQGVALLPFIDEKRLLDAMALRYPELSEDENRRNTWGSNVLLISDGSHLYDSLCALYTKKRSVEPVPIDVRKSDGISGAVLADPGCVPGSTYFSPLVASDSSDIHDDRSISALYYFPKQLKPHRSLLLPGVRRDRPRLTAQDQEMVRRGGQRPRGGGRGGGDYSYGAGRGADGVYGIGGFSSYGLDSRNGYGRPHDPRTSYSGYSYGGRGQSESSNYGGRGGYGSSGSYGSRGGRPNGSYGSAHDQPPTSAYYGGYGGSGYANLGPSSNNQSYGLRGGHTNGGYSYRGGTGRGRG